MKCCSAFVEFRRPCCFCIMPFRHIKCKRFIKTILHYISLQQLGLLVTKKATLFSSTHQLLLLLSLLLLLMMMMIVMMMMKMMFWSSALFRFQYSLLARFTSIQGGILILRPGKSTSVPPMDGDSTLLYSAAPYRLVFFGDRAVWLRPQSYLFSSM